MGVLLTLRAMARQWGPELVLSTRMLLGLVLPTGKLTGLERQSPLWEQSQSLSFLVSYLVFEIPRSACSQMSQIELV